MFSPRRKGPNTSVSSLTSDLEAFYLLHDKQDSFLTVVNSILSGTSVSILTLQRLVGKCISFCLAVQDSRLYTNEMNLSVSKGTKSSKLVRISPSLWAEIRHLADPSVIARIGKWRDERHLQFVIFLMRPLLLGEAFSPKKSRHCFGSQSFATLDITTKETKALSNTLLSFGDELRDARVDAYVDSQSLVQAKQFQVARSSLFSDALKQLSEVVLDLIAHLSVIYIPSGDNPGD